MITIATDSGPLHVHHDDDTVQAYGISLKGSRILPWGVVYPRTESELSAALAYARANRLPVYPLSCGKNWGYGSAQGTAAGQLVVDLSKMNQIGAVDERLGTATIQPGVSQQQLAAHLREAGSRLQLDVTGAPRDTSLMGNYLERGFGHTDYGFRHGSIIQLRVMLASGAVITTGFGAFAGARGAAYRPGIGPCVDGLFSQSNLGIVTEMTFALMPRPAHFCMFGLFCREEADLGELVEVLRELRLHGVVNSAVHIANLARATGASPAFGEPHWIATGAISGERGISRARKRALQRALRGRLAGHKLVFFTDRKIRLLEWLHRNVAAVPMMDGIRTARDLQQGVPTDQPTATLLADPSGPLPDAARDFGSRFLWVNATCDAERDSIEALNAMMKDRIAARGDQYRVTFTFLTPRTLVMIADTRYDSTPDAVADAQAFYAGCVRDLIARGFCPYRSGSGSHAVYGDALDPAYRDVLARLKAALDPEGILAPGKYNLGSHSDAVGSALMRVSL